MICRRCNIEMEPGQALESTLVVGLPDFPGQTDLNGQTLSPGGPGRLIDVLKCLACGHSRAMSDPIAVQQSKA